MGINIISEHEAIIASLITLLATSIPLIIEITKDPGFYEKLKKSKYFHVAAVVILLIIGAAVYPVIHEKIYPPEIKINYNSETANIEEYINGTAKNIPEGQEIWILVYPQTADKYYPICKGQLRNGEWTTFPLPVHLGTENDTDTKFDILAILADREAQDELGAYFERGIRENYWPGMPRIPDSVEFSDKKTVVRNSTIAFAATSTSETLTPPPAEITITYPSALPKVNITETIHGTAKNISEGQQFWIAVYPQTAFKYYPQNPVNIQSDGSWDVPAQFGGENNVGEKFDIVAVLADKNAQTELNKYMDASEKAVFWPGMRELPNGTTKITNLTVIRI